MGCPVKKVVNGYAGSALMKNEILAKSILEAVVKSVKVPVTLKMRKGWDENSLNAPACKNCRKYRDSNDHNSRENKKPDV